MTSPASTNARRKAARELLRDAQLPGLTDRSRSVLAVTAIQLCTMAVFEDIQELMRAGVSPQVSSEMLIASAKELLKRRR